MVLSVRTVYLSYLTMDKNILRCRIHSRDARSINVESDDDDDSTDKEREYGEQDYEKEKTYA